LLIVAVVPSLRAENDSLPPPDSLLSTRGIYNYSDQNYGYERQTVGDLIDYTSMGLSSLNGAVDRTIAGANVGFLTTHGDLAFESSTGLGHTFGLGFSTFGESPARYFDPNSLHMRLGPVAIDEIDVGAGVLFTDTTGSPPQLRGDDGWGSIVWASARVSLDLTDRMTFTLRPIVYWLPNEGEVGYGLPPAILGLPVLDPYSYATLSYTAPIADWDVTLFDSFGAFYRYWNFWDRNQLQLNTWSDLTPVDTVGQYSLGGFGPQVDFTLDEAPHSSIDFFDKDRLFFENWAGFRANGKHGSQLQSLIYFDRRDRWDGDFDWGGAWMQGGAYLAQQRDHWYPYTGYNFWTNDNFNSVTNWAVTGARFDLGPRAYGFAQAGLFFSSGTSKDYTDWLGEIGATQILGPYTRHGFQAGRRLSDPDGQQRYIEDYAEYTIGQDLGPNSTLIGIAGYADRHNLDHSTNDNQKVILAGLHYTQYLPSTNTTLGLLAGYEHIQQDSNMSDFDRWIYRASILQELRRQISLTLVYQYTAAWGEGTKDDYTEHFLWMGVQKRF